MFHITSQQNKRTILMLPKNADKIFYDNFSSNTFERKNQFHSFLCLRPQILWSCFSCNNRNWWEKKITYYMSSMNHAFFPQGISWGITVIILEFKKIIIKNYSFREKVTTKNRQHFCLLIKLIKEYIYPLFLGWTFPKATILVHY